MKSIKTLVAAAALSVSTVATAMPTLITEWDFVNEAGWEFYLRDSNGDYVLDINGDLIPTATPSYINESGLSNNPGDSILSTGVLPTDLCWGTPVTGNGQSCLLIDSPITQDTGGQGRVETVAIGGDYTTGFKNGTSLTHNNFVIQGSSLDLVTLVDGLQLEGFYDNVPGPGQTTVGKVLAPELQFSVNFEETRNAGFGVDGTCPVGPNSGTGFNANGCADIFSVIGFAGGNIIDSGVDFIDFAVDFVVSGVGPNVHNRYELITRLSGLQTLGGGAFGFITEEEKANVLNAQFAVRAVPVPEPSTIAVFALGLVGLTFLGRRKKA